MLSPERLTTPGFEKDLSSADELAKPNVISNEEIIRTDTWQKRLLPWMVVLPTLLVGAFIFLASLRMNKIESFIYKNDASFLDGKMISPEKLDLRSPTAANMEYINLYVLTEMEQYSMNKRYSQAAAITMSTIYSKYLGFFTGMILAIVGAIFIISKLKESSTNIEASMREELKFKLLSSSPGIIFGFLGAALMTITILHKGEVNVNDSPLYLNHYNLSRAPYDPNRPGIDSSNINQLTDTPRQKRISKNEADSINLDD